MPYLFQSWSWSQVLFIAQGIVSVFLVGVGAFYSLRMGSTKAWKERAEERKEAIADLEAELKRLERQLVGKSVDCENLEREKRDAERRSNEASQFNLQLQGKVRVYERRHGVLKPEDLDY